MGAESLILRLAVIAIVIAVVMAVYSPGGSLAVSSGFGFLRSVFIGLTGLGLVFTGTGVFWVLGAILFGVALYLGRGHKDRFARSTNLRSKLNG